MDSLPLISICIPTYNAGKHFEPCLQSALAQTYPHCEILISDDGSTDTTLEVVTNYQQKHANIRLVQNPIKGMVANWENCILQANGNWIKYLFQDDVLEPDCVQKMLALCRSHNVDIGFCRRNFIVEDNAPPESIEYTQVANKAETIFSPGLITPSTLAAAVKKYGTENIIGEPTCLLFHKNILEKAGTFNRHFYQSVDLEFALRAAFIAGIAFTNEALAHFRIHGGSQTSNNTAAKPKPEQQVRRLRSMWGDDMLLLHLYGADKHFDEVRRVWPKEELVNLVRYKYLRACKEFGSRLVNEALQDIRPLIPEIKTLTYNYLVYKREKWKYKAYRKRSSV